MVVMGWSIARTVGLAALPFFVDPAATRKAPRHDLSRPPTRRGSGRIAISLYSATIRQGGDDRRHAALAGSDRDGDWAGRLRMSRLPAVPSSRPAQPDLIIKSRAGSIRPS